MNSSRRKPQNPEVRRILGLPPENEDADDGAVETAKHRPGHCGDIACDADTCMDLPDGKTCLDCRHKVRCVSMFGAELTNDHCQWFPRRFSQTSLVVEGGKP